MEFLPAALYALNFYKQFIIYQVVPSKSRPGKSDKFPININTGNRCNAHDPAAWMTGDEACAMAICFGKGYGVGFVITKDDPFWFLDIDGAYANGQWSPVACELVRRLQGAAVEVSLSNTGLHILGTGTIPAHSCRNAEHHIELYSSGRFVALTGVHASGDVMADFTPQLTSVINDYFPASSTSAGSGDILERWSQLISRGAREDWNGDKNDDELIRRMCRDRVDKSVFGTASTKATPKQLWEGDQAALALAFPDPDRECGYDQSQADAALIQHLCFWTGCDGERIRRLMERSALRRDKFDRPDYLPRSILLGCDRQIKVLADKREPDNSAAVSDNQVRELFTSIERQKEIFAGCTFVQNENAVLAANGTIIKESAFKVMYGSRTYILDATNSKTTTNAYEAFTNNREWQPPKVVSTSFRPDLPFGTIIEEEEGVKLVNDYFPIATKQKKGDPTLFLKHLEKLFPGELDRKIILSYLAAVVQHPGVKFKWCPFIQGVEGNGKTLLSLCVAYAVGEKYSVSPKAAELDSRFNGFMDRTILVSVEDIFVTEGKNEIYEALKPMITCSRLEIERKGKDKETKRVCANFIINSNHKDGLRKTKNNRTFAPFYTPQQQVEDLERDGMDSDYFAELYGWLYDKDGFQIVNHLLHNYEIPYELNPAKGCMRAPKTTSTDQATAQSGGRIEQEIIEAIDEGRIGFRNGWISSHFLDQLLTEVKGNFICPRNKRKDLLASLGYSHHPSLSNGRASRPVLPDGAKPRLYLVKGHPCLTVENPAKVCEMYEEDQKN